MDSDREVNQMSTLYYSPGSRGFYASDVHEPEAIPGDAVEVTPELHATLLAAEATGKDIVFDDGRRQPVARDREVSLTERKALKIDELTTAFETALNAGFDSDALGTSHRYDSEPHNRENLMGAVATGMEQPFTCDDGQGHPHSKQQRLHRPEQLRQVLIDGAARKQALIATLRAGRDAVIAATSEAGLADIAWTDPAVSPSSTSSKGDQT